MYENRKRPETYLFVHKAPVYFRKMARFNNKVVGAQKRVKISIIKYT